jgi:hypothetical protein
VPLNARGAGRLTRADLRSAPSIEENKFETWTLKLQCYKISLLRTLKHSFWAWVGRREL